MQYDQIQISKESSVWTANPNNWEELAFTLNNEEQFLSYDPNANWEMKPWIEAELKLYL